jgi:hypothetical protein
MKRDQIGKIPPTPGTRPAEDRLPQRSAKELKQREKVMEAAFGIFKGKDVFPDGLEYQLAVRAEWD